jgi:hypothetical protein
MEKKRRSRTRRDQPTADKPGQPYQKSYPNMQTGSLTAQPTSPGPSGRSRPRRGNILHVSRVEASSNHFDPLPPRTLSHKSRSLHSSTTPPSRDSSPYHSGTGTSSSSPESRNLSPFPGFLPTPTPTFDHFQHMTRTTQPIPDSLSPSSSGYYELQSDSRDLPGDFGLWHPVSQTIPVDGSRPATMQSNDIYGSSRPCRNEYDRQQGQIETIYPRFLASHPSTRNGLATPAEGFGGDHFYSGYENHTTGALLQDI